MSVSYFRTFKHCQSVAKRPPNGFTDVKSSAAPALAASILTDRRSSLNIDKLRNPKIFQKLPIKAAKFSNSLIPTAWPDIDNRLRMNS